MAKDGAANSSAATSSISRIGVASEAPALAWRTINSGVPTTTAAAISAIAARIKTAGAAAPAAEPTLSSGIVHETAEAAIRSATTPATIIAFAAMGLGPNNIPVRNAPAAPAAARTGSIIATTAE
jgi:hypothetical protein